jgi:hypothetical protein
MSAPQQISVGERYDLNKPLEIVTMKRPTLNAKEEEALGWWSRFTYLERRSRFCQKRCLAYKTPEMTTEEAACFQKCKQDHFDAQELFINESQAHRARKGEIV